jgi:integrase/recombinase XerD
MTNWAKTVRDYLGLRRALGFKLEWAGTELTDFARLLQRESAAYLSVALALKWAHRTASGNRSSAARRLSLVRGFARYLCAADSRTEVPPISLLPYRPKRARPYLYTDEEIRALLSAALQLAPNDALRRWTYCTLFGLLSVSGLRIREALNLRLKDVDFQAGVLHVQKAKMGQSRLVPLHASTKQHLIRYGARRDRYLAGRDASDFFFVSKRGNRMDGAEVRRTFYLLSRQTGLRGATDSHGPRIHDIRHRFATQTLINWYRSGVDAERRISVLSTYLGHVHVADTYWYLSACPELMGYAVKRLERRWNELS